MTQNTAYERTCSKCGEPIEDDPDGSEGVVVHARSLGDRAFDLDDDHTPFPDMMSVIVKYTFVVDVEDATDKNEVAQTVREYIDAAGFALDEPDSIEVEAAMKSSPRSPTMAEPNSDYASIDKEAWVRKMALDFFAANFAEAAGDSFDLPPGLGFDEGWAIAERLAAAEHLMAALSGASPLVTEGTAGVTPAMARLPQGHDRGLGHRPQAYRQNGKRRRRPLFDLWREALLGRGRMHLLLPERADRLSRRSRPQPRM